MTAPERIWAGRYHGTWWQSTPHHQMTEYIRADLVGKSHNPLSAALELPEVRALVDASRALHADLIARGETDRDGVVTVNAGRTAWFDFNAALRAIEGSSE